MTLLGAIVDYYENSADATAVTLRSLLPEMWKDEAPEDVALPYVRLIEVGTGLISEGKNNSYRIDSVTVQFDVFTNGAAAADAILEALENCYLRTTLTVANRNHLATYFNGRNNVEEGDVDHGILELDFRLEKTPQ